MSLCHVDIFPCALPPRSCLPAASVPLWERWLRHALLLRELDVLSCEELLQVFTPALVERTASYTDKVELLKLLK